MFTVYTYYIAYSVYIYLYSCSFFLLVPPLLLCGFWGSEQNTTFPFPLETDVELEKKNTFIFASFSIAVNDRKLNSFFSLFLLPHDQTQNNSQHIACLPRELGTSKQFNVPQRNKYKRQIYKFSLPEKKTPSSIYTDSFWISYANTRLFQRTKYVPQWLYWTSNNCETCL